MISIKKPFGAIHKDWIAWLLPPRPNGKFYVLDCFSTAMEVEETVYRDLEKKGVKVYEGRINQSRID